MKHGVFIRKGRELSFSKRIHYWVQDEIAADRLKNRVNPKRAFLFPIPVNDFMDFRMVRPRWRLNSCVAERSNGMCILKNYLPDALQYELPTYEETELHREYCHGEPPSSYKDFLVMDNYAEQERKNKMEIILEEAGVLSDAVRILKSAAGKKAA